MSVGAAIDGDALADAERLTLGDRLEEGDTDAEVDLEALTDGDTEADGETEADGLTLAEAETDGDRELDADSDVETDGETEALGLTDAETERDTDAEALTDADTDGDSELEGDRDGDADGESELLGLTEEEGEVDGLEEADADREGEMDADVDAEADADGEMEADADRDADCEALTDGLTDGDADAEGESELAAPGFVTRRSRRPSMRVCSTVSGIDPLTLSPTQVKRSRRIEPTSVASSVTLPAIGWAYAFSVAWTRTQSIAVAVVRSLPPDWRPIVMAVFSSRGVCDAPSASSVTLAEFGLTAALWVRAATATTARRTVTPARVPIMSTLVAPPAAPPIAIIVKSTRRCFMPWTAGTSVAPAFTDAVSVRVRGAIVIALRSA